jgi:isopenicillin N synthase-like dioxygenase
MVALRERAISDTLYSILWGTINKCCTETCAFRHTDYGITTLLFSIPITGLQIWKENKWRFVKYKPGASVINLGETLEGW